MNDFCLNDLGEHAIFYGTRLLILNTKNTIFDSKYKELDIKPGKEITLFAYDNHAPKGYVDEAPFLLKIFDEIMDFNYIYVSLLTLRRILGAGQFIKVWNMYQASINHSEKVLDGEKNEIKLQIEPLFGYTM